MPTTLSLQAVISADSETFKFPRVDSRTQQVTLKSNNAWPERGGYPGVVNVYGTLGTVILRSDITSNTCGFAWLLNTSDNPNLWVEWGPWETTGSLTQPLGVLRPGEPCLIRLLPTIDGIRFEHVAAPGFSVSGTAETMVQVFIFDE
jgi:hypothetical protein